MGEPERTEITPLEEICRAAFVGLWSRMPADNGLDMEFVRLNDAYNVLSDSLKTDIKELMLNTINEAREKDLPLAYIQKTVENW